MLHFFFFSIAILRVFVCTAVTLNRLTGWLVGRKKQAPFSGSLARLNKLVNEDRIFPCHSGRDQLRVDPELLFLQCSIRGMLKFEEKCGGGSVEGKVVLCSLRSADDGDLGTVAGQCLGHTLADTGSTTYINI